jgi:hypothetical protein
MGFFGPRTCIASRAARFLVSKDRGQNIRTEEGYAALCGRESPTVRTHVDASPLLIHYTGIVITCSTAHRLTDERITDE